MRNGWVNSNWDKYFSAHNSKNKGLTPSINLTQPQQNQCESLSVPRIIELKLRRLVK